MEEALNDEVSSSLLLSDNPIKAGKYQLVMLYSYINLMIPYINTVVALEAARSLIIGHGCNIIGKDIKNIHGIVVWCLISDIKHAVEYHIDYAELYR